MAITRKLAETRLRKRYYQQALIYPVMLMELPLEQYISSNIDNVMRNDLLSDYDRLPNWHPRKYREIDYDEKHGT